MRTIIIDDEKQIREGLKILLSQIDDIDIVGEASTATEAINIIEELKPDVVLLDIQLKNKTGFDVLNGLSNLDFKLIFVTAYNEYAIKAFKYNAFDYLLKPIDPEELNETIQRLKTQKNHNVSQLQELHNNTAFNNLVIKTTQQIYVLPLKEIIRCEAEQGYTHFYTQDNKHILSSKTLKEYNALLPKKQFLRVHQSHLVNRNYITSYDKKGFLYLRNKKQIPVSVRKRTLITEILKNSS